MISMGMPGIKGITQACCDVSDPGHMSIMLDIYSYCLESVFVAALLQYGQDPEKHGAL